MGYSVLSLDQNKYPEESTIVASNSAMRCGINRGCQTLQAIFLPGQATANA